MNLKEPIKATESDLHILVHNVSRSTSYAKRTIEGFIRDIDLDKNPELHSLKMAISSIISIDKEIDKFYQKCYPEDAKP